MGKKNKEGAFKRKQILIDKPFQFRYMAYLLVILMSAFVLVFANFYMGIWGGILDALSNEKIREELLVVTTEEGWEEVSQAAQKDFALAMFEQANKLSLKQQEVVSSILNRTNRQLIPSFVFLIIVICWGSMFITHRLAGPIFRIRSDLKEVQKGRVSKRIYLRSKDEGETLVQDINRTIASFDITLAQMKKILREHGDDPGRMKSRLEEELSKYRTSGE